MQESGTPVQTEQLICEACGGTLKWNITKRQFECAACRTPTKVTPLHDCVVEHPMEDYAARSAKALDMPGKASVYCQNCGSQVLFDEMQTATVCPMCGSSQVSKERQLSGVAPDGIIPFLVDKAQAQENFHQWVKSRWFAPNALKKSYQSGHLEGMYLPFWTFDAEAEADYRGEGGTHYTTTDKDGKETTHTRWTPVSGRVALSFDDLPVCATANRVREVVDRIQPYNTSTGSAPFATAYLSGFAAERYSVGADQAFGSAQEEMEGQLREAALSQIRARYDEARVSYLNAEYHEVKYKHVLLPAWSSAFAYSGKEYLYLINGETGAVGGQRPYSVPKIIAACLVVAALIAAIFIWVESDEQESAVAAENGRAITAIAEQGGSDWAIQQMEQWNEGV